MRTFTKFKFVNRFGRGLILHLSVLMALAFLFSGCGKKGPPVAPHQEKPPPVNDLAFRVDEDFLVLSWTISQSKVTRFSDPGGFIVHRSKEKLSEPECKNCPILFQRVADIPIRWKDAKASDKQTMTYKEILEKGFRYKYKVTRYTNTGIMGSDANTVSFIY